MDEIKEMKCNYCKVFLPIHKFSKNRAEKYLKSCDECREKQKIIREKNKCQHGRKRHQCKDCGGASICEHDRVRNTCKDCGGSQICEHEKRRSQCKDCGGNQICEHGRIRNTCKDCGGASICEHDRIRSTCKDCMNDEQKIEYIQKTMIKSSRKKDKKKNRYDPDNFIDKCFLEGLFEDSNTCHYCNVDFTYNELCDTFVTIERLNNNIGHKKSNCVLACWKCNLRHNDKNDIRE